MEDITDADCMHAKKICKDFEIKHLGEYHDLYLKSDTLLLADVFENFKKICLKIYHLDPVKFLSAPGLAWEAALTKTKIRIINSYWYAINGRGIGGGICYVIHWHAKANNKYTKDYAKNKESSYLKYWNVNDLYGWAMSQKLPVNKVEWIENTSQFNENFIKNYNENSDEGYFLEIDVQYPKKLHKLHNVLPFLFERMKIEKVEKLVTNLHEKTEYVIPIRNWKQALDHGLILWKVHRAIKFNQKAWLKLYIGINTELRQKAENNFEKYFFKLMNNAFFEKTMENVRKHRNIKLVTTERRRNYLESESNFHATKFFSENLLAIEMRKTQIIVNKPVYLGLQILDLNKTVVYESWYDYVKLKYGENAKLCCMDIDSLIVHVKADGVYKDITEDVETRFDTSNFEIDRPLPKEKKKKIIGLMKNKLDGQIIEEFFVLRAKIYSYLKDNNDEDKKAKA